MVTIRRFAARAFAGSLALMLCAALLGGCKSSGSNEEAAGTGILRAGLPPGATVVAEGTAQLTYSPEESGTIFLYDVAQDRVVGRFHLIRGQRMAMDGALGRATIDGNEVRIGQVRQGGNYQIYFLRDPAQ